MRMKSGVWPNWLINTSKRAVDDEEHGIAVLALPRHRFADSTA